MLQYLWPLRFVRWILGCWEIQRNVLEESSCTANLKWRRNKDFLMTYAYQCIWKVLHISSVIPDILICKCYITAKTYIWTLFWGWGCFLITRPFSFQAKFGLFVVVVVAVLILTTENTNTITEVLVCNN